MNALESLGHGSGPATWPPEVPDHFPDAVGLPEISREELTTDAVRSGVFHHGGLLVRGLLDPVLANAFVELIDEVLAAREASLSTPPRHEPDPIFVPAEIPEDPGLKRVREFAHADGSVLAIDAPRVLFDLVETFERAGIRELVEGFFGERPTMLAKKWTLRRVSPDISRADWHQDGSFMGADIRSLNVWIALSDCGKDAPSMDVVARRLDTIAETGTEGAYFDWSVSPAVAEDVADGTIVRPRFAPGDALLFDHLLLHKTDTHPGMTQHRYAIEAWLASAATAPPDQLPIVY